MSRKRKSSNFMERCRLCLAEDGAMVDLFDGSLQKRIDDLSTSTAVQITHDDNLPKNVCHVCLYKLDMWSEFKQRFIESNRTLMMHLEASEQSHFTTLKPKNKKNDDETEEKIDLTSSQDNLSLSFERSAIQMDDYSSSKDSPKASQENGSLNDETSTTPTKSAHMKRSKVTERRKASTKRWVARKKALIAATGEDASDSDSANSDNAQLSPVQKARAKTNADKEAERQRRIAKALKHLATDMVTDSILPADPESRRTRSRYAKSQSSEREHQKPNSKSDENFTPRSVRAELEMGDATYIVTSTLFFADSQNGPTTAPTTKGGATSGEEKVDENTDIFDAVQLRRINPKSSPPAKESSYLERCLNIEVEGSELEALQRVQQELAIFVEKEMKHKMAGTEPPPIPRRGRSKDPAFVHLDNQLKGIVEKAIKKNYEASQNAEPIAAPPQVAPPGGAAKVISPAFMEAAMRSKIFQPQVVVEKMDVVEASKNYIINNLRREEAAPPSPPRKRQITTPLRYQDYDISDGIFGDEVEESLPTRRPGPLGATKAPRMMADKAPPPKSEKTEKHMCAFCNKMFDNRRDIELHVKTHKSAKPTSASAPTPAGGKVRRMRCKRCQEIVEARFVKMHKCRQETAGAFKCTICSAAFRTEVLLNEHKEQHKKIKIEKENKPVISSQNPQKSAVPIKLEPQIAEAKSTDSATMCFLCDKKFTDQEMLKDHLQKHCDEISDQDDRLGKDEEYQCAICCKTLESEEALEAHVEKHLYDEEDDNPNLISIENVENENAEKKQTAGFSCSECGETFASELLLVIHQPLHEEEAEIAEWEKRREDSIVYGCDICDATFSSEIELSEHAYTHEEAHVCLLCEQPFDNLEQLQKHVATH